MALYKAINQQMCMPLDAPAAAAAKLLHVGPLPGHGDLLLLLERLFLPSCCR
jgi:hypothetical protein